MLSALIYVGVLLLHFTNATSEQASSIAYFDAATASSSQCNTRTNGKNFTGLGFLDFLNPTSWMDVKIDLPEVATVLIVRYTAGYSDYPVDLMIDGKLIDTLKMRETKDWNTWGQESVFIPAISGRHIIRLASRLDRGPYIDWIGLYRLQWGQAPLVSAPYRLLSAMPSSTPVTTLRPTRHATRRPTQFSTSLATPMPTRASTLRASQPQSTALTRGPSRHPTRAPSPFSISAVVPKPIVAPSPAPISCPFSTILSSGSSMSVGDVISSPSGRYRFGLYQNGNLQLTRSKTNEVIWRSGTSGTANCFMQSDGNLVTKLASKKVNWQSETGQNPGAVLILDDCGQVSIVYKNSALWLAGLPRGQYSGPSCENLLFPVRGAFYYPWYPETWSVNGKPVFYHPTLGRYSAGMSFTHNAHVDALEYAYVDLAIASWWGPDLHLDRARITNLLNASLGKNVKWAIYHEKEYLIDQSVTDIRQDLAYLKKWFAWHEAWAHIDGRPIIFVYNEAGCEVAARWNSASLGQWYVVLKVFAGHEDCKVQPDHWHQYGPAAAVVHNRDHSFAVSPGFWRADKASPTLRRVSKLDWRANVLSMVNSKEDWQLVTTFNEWGEGTAVESAQEWASSSGYGFYLDALHDIH